MSDAPLIIMPAAWASLPVSDGEFRVLAVICQYAHLGSDEGCLKSYDAIGEACHVHRDTVKKAVRKLKGLGVLRVEVRGGGPGERSSTNRLVPNWKIEAGLIRQGEGGAASPRGAGSPDEGGATTPHKLYEGSSNNTTTAPAHEGLETEFADPEHRAAYLAYRRSHRMPDGLDAGIRSVHQPPAGGKSFDWSTIGAALVEMRARQGEFSVVFLRACCRRIVGGEILASIQKLVRTPDRDAAAFWQLCKDGGLLTAPSREALDEAVDDLVSAGRVGDKAAFLQQLHHVRPWEFANARTADWAIAQVAERLAGMAA